MRLEIGTKSNETKPKEVVLTMSINPAIPVGICLISCALIIIKTVSVPCSGDDVTITTDDDLELRIIK